MDTDQDLKLAIAWNKFNLDFVGIWPDPLLKKGRFSKYKCLIPAFCMLAFLNGPQTGSMLLIWGDMTLISENMAAAYIPNINAFLKLCITWYHREALRTLLASFYEDWRAPKTEEERAIMLNNANIGKKISVWCSLVTEVATMMFLTLRTVTILSMDRSEQNPDRIVIFPGYFPYNVRSSPILAITCVAQAMTSACATICYVGVDSFVSMLVVHARGQFIILRRKLENLISDRTNTKSGKEFQEKLVWIVKRHNYLNWFATNIENSFNVLLLLQMLFSTIELCFQCFHICNKLLQHDEEQLVLHLVFFPIVISFMIFHLFLFCYMGEILLVESSGMYDSAYKSEWFNVSPKEAKCLLLIMHRSSIPLRLTAGKFATFSMELFGNILKTSMGYLSVLLTVSGGGD